MHESVISHEFTSCPALAKPQTTHHSSSGIIMGLIRKSRMDSLHARQLYAGAESKLVEAIARLRLGALHIQLCARLAAVISRVE